MIDLHRLGEREIDPFLEGARENRLGERLMDGDVTRGKLGVADPVRRRAHPDRELRDAGERVDLAVVGGHQDDRVRPLCRDRRAHVLERAEDGVALIVGGSVRAAHHEPGMGTRVGPDDLHRYSTSTRGAFACASISCGSTSAVVCCERSTAVSRPPKSSHSLRQPISELSGR